jgi:hypothetical protein
LSIRLKLLAGIRDGIVDGAGCWLAEEPGVRYIWTKGTELSGLPSPNARIIAQCLALGADNNNSPIRISTSCRFEESLWSTYLLILSSMSRIKFEAQQKKQLTFLKVYDIDRV